MTYLFPKVAADAGVLYLELVAASLPVTFVTGPFAGSVSVTASRDLTAGEQASASGIVSGHPNAAFATKRLNDGANALLSVDQPYPSDVQSLVMMCRGLMRMCQGLMNEIRPPVNRPPVAEPLLTNNLVTALTSGVGLLSGTVPVGTLGNVLSKYRSQRIPTPAMTLSAGVDITVAWATPFPDATDYTVNCTLEATSLLGVTPIVKPGSRTQTGCIVSLKASVLVTLLAGAGTLHVIAVSDTN